MDASITSQIISDAGPLVGAIIGAAVAQAAIVAIWETAGLARYETEVRARRLTARRSAIPEPLAQEPSSAGLGNPASRISCGRRACSSRARRSGLYGSSPPTSV